MSKPPRLDRRMLLAGAAVTAAAAATAQGQKAALPLNGKVILITGASSGFGRLGAVHYARLGARVFASMRNLPRREAQELTALATKDKLAIEVIGIDVTSDAQVDAGMAHVLKAAGGIDVLINNAAISFSGPVEVQDMAATALMFDTNVMGPHRLARAALPAMRAKKSGLIINISSQLGRLIVPAYGHYSATKFALEAMSEQLAYEVASHGIEVSIVQPGGYPTEIWANSSKLSAALKARTPKPLLDAYGPLAASMGDPSAGGVRNTDPMDVPRAIAEIIAMPAGARPLRRAVHPTWRPQEGLNAAAAKAQLAFLGASPFGPMLKAVLE
jgi:NAD(P)-dependent dehydrogenase (short-subunit alcohol dehydrogenase family)